MNHLCIVDILLCNTTIFFVTCRACSPFVYSLYNILLMSISEKKNPVCEKVCVTLPLGSPVPEGYLLEANAKFRDEILAFRAQELLNECK